MALKTRKDAQVEGLPAAARKTLWVKLGGEQKTDPDNGSPAVWTFGDAVKWLKTRHQVTLSENTISKWFARRCVHAMSEWRVRLVTSSMMGYAEAKGGEVDLSVVSDATILTTLGEVIEGRLDTGDAARFINSLSGVKRICVDKEQLAQKVREYEESTEALRKEITKLREFISGGATKGELTEDDNKALVRKVDELMGLTKAK